MRRSFLFLLLAILVSIAMVPAVEAGLSLKAKSVRFAVIGDSGTGDRTQYDIGRLMEDCRKKASFDFVIMLGDNIYGADTPADFRLKFEAPYKPLLDAGVKFYASLGNHDNPNQRFYKLFNMNEATYYTFKKGNVHFYVLDSNYMDAKQLEWLQKQLQEAGEGDWKIC